MFSDDDDERHPRRRRDDPDDSEEERPRRRRRDEDEEEEERPRRSRRDPDEEEERPRRRSRKQEREEAPPKRGFPVLLLLLGGGAALLAVFGVCVGVVVIGLKTAPDDGGGGGGGILGGGDTKSWRGKRIQPAAANVDLGGGTRPIGPYVLLSRDEPLRALVYRTSSFGPVTKRSVSLHDLRGGRSLGSADLPAKQSDPNARHLTLGPEGDRFAMYEESRDFKKGYLPRVLVYSVPDGKPVGDKWQLEDLTRPKRSGDESRLAFMRLLSRDKLLTVSTSGIVETWDVAARTPARLAEVAKPGACALSNDRTTLAVWSGAGFSILDLGQANAQPRRTQDVIGAQECTAACFSPDGKRLAATVSAGGQTSVVCFDVATGKQLGQATQRHSHLAWWGNRYVIPNEGYGNAYLFDSDAGKIVTQLLVYSAYLLPESPDGRLYLTSANVEGRDVDKGLTIFDPPVADVAAAAAQGQLIFRREGVYGN
jgi:hypothetical protein